MNQKDKGSFIYEKEIIITYFQVISQDFVADAKSLKSFLCQQTEIYVLKA